MSEASFELAIERRIAAPPAAVWRAWTERIAEWWAPPPFTTRVIAQELRAGGSTCLEMRGPEGEPQRFEGVFLEVVPEERIVFTNAFTAGWVPQAPFMVGLFTFAPEGDGTHYTAAARHWDEAAMQRHEAMGFREGWALVAGQLAAIAEAG